MRFFQVVLIVAAASGLSSCLTTGQTAALPPINSPYIPSISTLQLAVGTATIAEPSGSSEIGLNIVTTFRIPGGGDATLQNTPTLQGPMTFITDATTSNPRVVSGVLPTQLALLASKGTKIGVSDAFKEFGATVGVFGYGLAGDNTLSPTIFAKVYPALVCGDIGGTVAATSTSGPSAPAYNAPRSQELTLPVFVPSASGCGFVGNFSGIPVTTAYYGGPPAWPSPSGYGQPAFFRGYPLGFTDFASHPVPGVYQLLVTFTTTDDYSNFVTMGASATLPSSAVTSPLAPFPQPVLHVQNDGSAIVNVTVPPGVREAVININATDCLLAANRPNNNYSLFTRVIGPQTLFLSSHLGPPDQSGAPTHTFCTLADVAAAKAVSPPGAVFPTTGNYTLSAVGFDYPAYEASYPQSTSTNPAITNGDGHHGTADVTTANPAVNAYTFGTGAR